MDWYGDIDTMACAWVHALIAAELIPIGDVDSRSIQEVTGDELRGYRRCHFFAGIAGWAEALRLAEWPAAVPVWTGSCPCQPFSVAGKGKGTADERHVWPEFRRLIDQCRPPIVFGEQVASKLGREWLAGVRTDLEALGYAVGAADLCAASVGAPHIRQRLYWVAYGNGERFSRRKEPNCQSEQPAQQASRRADSLRCSGVSGMANPRSIQRRTGREGTDRHQSASDVDGSGHRMVDSGSARLEKRISAGRVSESQVEAIASEAVELASNHWDGTEWIACADGKTRPVKPGIQLLAHGIQGRVAQLRGLGNAIVPQVAAVFVKSFLEVVS